MMKAVRFLKARVPNSSIRHLIDYDLIRLQCEAGGGVWLQFGDELILKEYEDKIQEYFSEPRTAAHNPVRGQVSIGLA